MGALVVLKKVMVALISNKESRKTIIYFIVGSLFIAFLPIIIISSLLLSFGSNIDIISLTFSNEKIPTELNIETKENILNIREHFNYIDYYVDEIENNLVDESDEIDIYFIKSVFYVLYYGENRTFSDDFYKSYTESFFDFNKDEEDIRYNFITNKSKIYSNLKTDNYITVSEDEKENIENIYQILIGESGFLSENLLSEEEILKKLEELNIENEKRKKLVETALTLVDYTVYEWGGKSNASIRYPKGLDCSGFVAWAYARSGLTNSLQGGGTSYQIGLTTSISKRELKPGDLGFLRVSGGSTQSNANHVGIYMGNGLWVECYGGYGVGITNGKVFKYYRRVTEVDFGD